MSSYDNNRVGKYQHGDMIATVWYWEDGSWEIVEFESQDKTVELEDQERLFNDQVDMDRVVECWLEQDAAEEQDAADTAAWDEQLRTEVL